MKNRERSRKTFKCMLIVPLVLTGLLAAIENLFCSRGPNIIIPQWFDFLIFSLEGLEKNMGLGLSIQYAVYCTQLFFPCLLFSAVSVVVYLYSPAKTLGDRGCTKFELER